MAAPTPQALGDELRAKYEQTKAEVLRIGRSTVREFEFKSVLDFPSELW